jgi:hypothetical protein
MPVPCLHAGLSLVLWCLSLVLWIRATPSVIVCSHFIVGLSVFCVFVLLSVYLAIEPIEGSYLVRTFGSWDSSRHGHDVDRKLTPHF